MLRTAFGEDSLSQAVVYQWFRRFKEGCDSFKYDQRSGKPSTARTEEMIAQVKEKIHADRRLTIREISDEMNMSFGSCQAILTEDLRMKLRRSSCLDYLTMTRRSLVSTFAKICNSVWNTNKNS